MKKGNAGYAVEMTKHNDEEKTSINQKSSYIELTQETLILYENLYKMQIIKQIKTKGIQRIVIPR